MRDRWAVLVLLAGCVLTVVACTPADEPGTLPDRTDSVTTPAPTPTPTVTPTPTDPSAALEAEIDAFFREYIDTVNESWTSADALARRREMFADSCEDCLAGYTFAQRAHDEELTLDGGEVVVERIDLTGFEGPQAIFLTTEDLPAGSLTDASGTVVQSFDEYVDVQTAYQAVRTGSSWVIMRSDPL